MIPQNAALHANSRAVVIEAKSFACTFEDCNFKSYRYHHLKRHIMTHTKEKPFACPECGTKRARRDALAQHMKTHAKKDKCRCIHCSKKFNSVEEVQEHLDTAHRHICDKCKRNFVSTKQLSDHKREHNVTRCRMCAFSSTHYHKVMRHERKVHFISKDNQIAQAATPGDVSQGQTVDEIEDQSGSDIREASSPDSVSSLTGPVAMVRAPATDDNLSSQPLDLSVRSTVVQANNGTNINFNSVDGSNPNRIPPAPLNLPYELQMNSVMRPGYYLHLYHNYLDYINNPAYWYFSQN
ncbi:zinc finger protein 835-like [Varroa jacobsoni]|uniref:zinc finger protein 835-like n=1 Tax=Varroa jacobsoni TaxID=62625 RepID=UPI000BF6C49F|nr:zinc finger protein 835-like [Varroa jacobsoni]